MQWRCCETQKKAALCTVPWYVPLQEAEALLAESEGKAFSGPGSPTPLGSQLREAVAAARQWRAKAMLLAQATLRNRCSVDEFRATIQEAEVRVKLQAFFVFLSFMYCTCYWATIWEAEGALRSKSAFCLVPPAVAAGPVCLRFTVTVLLLK